MLKLDLKCHLGHFQKLGNSVHPYEEFLVQIQGISGLLLLHLKVLLEKIDNSVIVASKQSYQVSEQQHEAGVDHSVIQILQIRDSFSLLSPLSDNTVEVQSNSSRASTWFWRSGRVLRSLSPLIILRAPPSFLNNISCLCCSLAIFLTGLTLV